MFIDETRSFEPYLLHSITHAALNVAKKEARHTIFDEDSDPMVPEQLLQKASNAEDPIEYNCLKQEIYAALARLKPHERMVIIERYYLEMSEKEMATRHASAPGTIKWLLNSARRRLRNLISAEDKEL